MAEAPVAHGEASRRLLTVHQIHSCRRFTFNLITGIQADLDRRQNGKCLSRVDPKRAQLETRIEPICPNKCVTIKDTCMWQVIDERTIAGQARSAAALPLLCLLRQFAGEPKGHRKEDDNYDQRPAGHLQFSILDAGSAVE
jgi:hypothetical protein